MTDERDPQQPITPSHDYVREIPLSERHQPTPPRAETTIQRPEPIIINKGRDDTTNE